MQIIIIMTDEQQRILESDIVDITAWIENVWKNKLRKVGDSIVLKHTSYQPKKLSVVEKDHLIKNIVLDQAKDKDKKL